MKHALFGALSTLLLPFSSHAAASSAGGYLMRGGYQPRSYMRVGQAGDSMTSLPLGKVASRKHRAEASASANALDIRRHADITELVVIDSSVRDRATLYAGLNAGVGVVEIDAGRPGLPQLVQALQGYRDLAAVHVVSHASPGALQLGSSRVTAESVHAELGAMQALRAAVREGADLLFYGCDLAANDEGEQLLDIIRDRSGMDVAASSNLTGAAGQGGDWLLEVQRGDIQAALAFSDKALRDYSDALAAPSGVKTFSSGWTDNNFNLASADFIVTGKDVGGSPISNISIYHVPPNVAYLQTGYNGTTTGTYFHVAADGVSTGSFELTGLEAGEAPGLGGHFSNVRIVGIKPDNSTITSAPINGTGVPDETFSFGASQLAAFNGVKLKAFKLVFDTDSASNTKPFFEFRSFTIQGALAPVPQVTDARISISGASGTGGAYKIGDTVTASWNNTASGDNTAGVSGVTVDFSQFGGGSAVTATNSSDTWTATYTLTAGSLDTTNRNVSVTATNGNGSTTTVDTTNATVDTMAPTVTDGSISISGASGTGGAYRIGDTVTATWNNTGLGDNNSDAISHVLVNFSQFGGGSAVAATNSSGTWTATYTIVAGAIDMSGRNVTVTATDNAGNAVSTSDTSNATVDNIAPSVSSILVSGTPGSGDTSMAFTANFSESVVNVSIDDFMLVRTGSASGSIASISASSGSAINVDVVGISGTGSLKIDLNGSTNVADDAGNTVAAFSGGSTHSVAVLTAPDAPTIGAATAGDGQVSVAFTAPVSNGGSAITGYTVTSNPGNITAGGAGFTTSPITVPGLTNGTAYTFTVTATNAVGTSTMSGASAPITPKGAQSITFANPGAQTYGTSPDLSILGNGASATSGLPVTFTSSTAGVCTITSGGMLTFVTAGNCTITVGQSGNGSWSAAAEVSRTFTVNPIAPGVPTIGTATAGDTQADVTFTAPASTGGAAITSYTVTSHPGSLSGTGAGAPITVTGLTNGATYTFTVTATNSAGTSAASGASNQIVPASPQTITFANPGTQNYGTSPNLSILGGGVSSTSGLTVTFTSSTTGVCTITSAGVLTFFTAGTCSINADQAGNSSFLPAPQVTRSFTVNPVVPGAPVGAVATAGDTQARIDFVPPVDIGGSAITGYTVAVSPADVAPVSGASSPIVVSGLTNGQAYTFSVTAENVAGTGPASVASNSTTPKATQTITFSAPGAQNFGTAPTLSATSDSGLIPTFTSSTMGVCTITPIGVLTFVTAGSCTINADQAGNGIYLAAPQVTRNFAVNAVVPGTPTIGIATAQGIDTAEINFTAPASSGGVAITGYTVTANPGGLTKGGASSPITFTGLNPATTYTFTVTATNSVGTGSASAASNPVTTIPLLQANDVSDTVAYGAGATHIGLSITGTADEVLIISQPGHGIAAVSGTTVTYQPHPGYAGPDQFTYAAKDAYSTSAAARVDITVSAPALAMTTTTLPAAKASTPYAQTLVASGGTGPYRYAVSSGSLPNGVQLSADGALTGTPTQVGTFNVTITATDSSTGAGPFDVSHAFALEVIAAQVELDLDVLPPASGDQDYTQALTARGGTAPYRFAVTSGQLPPGLSLAADGTFSGEPEAAGSYTFALEVTDANGFTGTASLTLKVELTAQAITDMTTDPQAPVFAQGGSFTVSANGGASGNPVLFSSASPGVCSVSAAQVTMLAAGNCVLNADQSGNAMYQAATQARLEVAIAAATPTLQWVQALTKVYGEAAFDLVDPRSDSQGAFTFSSSNAAVATVSGRTVTLVGAGTATLIATQQAHGSYTAATVEVELTVNARPDPTLDAEVRGGIQAQVDASVRFARVQLSNIQARLQQVRSGDNPSSAALTLAYAGDALGQGMSVPVTLPMNSWNALPTGWGGWMSGTATFGNSGQQNGGEFDFHTDGISLGLDRALGENALMGAAASMGRNRSRQDHSPSRMDADQYSLALYGLWRSGEHLFVDGVLAHGWLDLDMARWSEVMARSASGQRDGRQTFGALTFGYQQQRDRFSLAGYGRFDGSRTTLDSYREHGLGVYDLDYAAQTVDNSGLAVGMDGSYLWRGDTLELRPFWKIEYRQSLSNTGDARINYVQQPVPGGYRLGMSSYADDMLTLGAGMDLRTQRGWLISLLFGRDQGRSSDSSNSVGLRISYGKGGASTMDMDAYSADGQMMGCQGRRCRNGQMRGGDIHP
ncbi:DUF4347 domain-containing protein [Stenotrophomonas sp. SY1]|uniref:DUF4347 domain-containing protein n=1 Tax=Stenotrophomonas sp. SY1 TaxID=477235 RepID=UPI001E3D72A5|nr:DUF4347 domain-containing protein [Stenotrophomonas sp. SY1]MCD9085830.1 DUF4347 domain-containing protein [Stenotrophomonas sp. SY1]